jgi:hypothetical protein
VHRRGLLWGKKASCSSLRHTAKHCHSSTSPYSFLFVSTTASKSYCQPTGVFRVIALFRCTKTRCEPWKRSRRGKNTARSLFHTCISSDGRRSITGTIGAFYSRTHRLRLKKGQGHHSGMRKGLGAGIPERTSGGGQNTTSRPSLFAFIAIAFFLRLLCPSVMVQLKMQIQVQVQVQRWFLCLLFQ